MGPTPAKAYKGMKATVPAFFLHFATFFVKIRSAQNAWHQDASGADIFRGAIYLKKNGNREGCSLS